MAGKPLWRGGQSLTGEEGGHEPRGRDERVEKRSDREGSAEEEAGRACSLTAISVAPPKEYAVARSKRGNSEGKRQDQDVELSECRRRSRRCRYRCRCKGHAWNEYPRYGLEDRDVADTGPTLLAGTGDEYALILEFEPRLMPCRLVSSVRQMSLRSQTVEQQNLCHQFSEITQATPEVAASILRKCKWNIRQAIEVYWESADLCSPAVDSSAIEALFDNYKDPDDNAIGVDGLINFCNDLEIPPDDLRMLYFCYNLKAKSAVRWTNGEFVQGLARLGVDSIVKIRDSLKSMRAELTSPSKFKDFYAYAFDISRQDGQKVLDLQTAIQLWKMLLEGRFEHLDLWCEYLEKVYQKSITKDTWQLTLEFSQTVNEDFSNIDLDNSAWPVVIDEFVEYCRAKVPS